MDYLERPGRPRLAYEKTEGAGPTILFLPGYGSDMTGGKATAMAAWAQANGRACLRFDYSGCGASDGVFAECTLETWAGDVLAVADALTEGPLILVGSSMGGWLMLLVALARTERIAGLVGIAAAPDFTEWGYDPQMREVLHRDGLLIDSQDEGDTPQVTMLALWESGQANLLLDGPIAIECPVRLLHGQEDRVVPPSIALRLGRGLRSADVQTVLVKGGDHRLSRPGDLRLLVATVASLADAP